uniref:Uncharacterized protein n=1 Tax=Utricularia reniformis TaxID=192314 RepID=A0A1Y0B257_9LAMI|nr:hypothetical protein AEK19_MT1275 [Utricularia reniformis]ART31480.1 hypothetical protein AEK19_MT1275 [Utricularia reniformis]
MNASRRSNNHAIWASITLPSSLAVQRNKPQLGATPVTGWGIGYPSAGACETSCPDCSRRLAFRSWSFIGSRHF